jgi:hypothetical protein
MFGLSCMKLDSSSEFRRGQFHRPGTSFPDYQESRNVVLSGCSRPRMLCIAIISGLGGNHGENLATFVQQCCAALDVLIGRAIFLMLDPCAERRSENLRSA